MQAAFERTLAFALERRAFGRAIGHHQAIRHKLAEIATEIEAARDVTYAALRAYLAGDAVREVTIAKLATQRTAFRVIDDCLQIHWRRGLHGGVRDRARGPRRPARPHRRRHRRDHEGDPGPLAGPVEVRRPRRRARGLCQTPGMESLTGQLLIAGPGLLDPNFWRTVVLVVEHGDEGALGLALNRPSETSAGEAVPELEAAVDPDERLFVGGPVQPSSVIVLAEFEDPSDATLIAFGQIGVLGGGAPIEALSVGVRASRAFAGHAGWSSGQLDAELERGDWILEPARREDAFCVDPSELWARALARKGGTYALIARMPPNPSLN